MKIYKKAGLHNGIELRGWTVDINDDEFFDLCIVSRDFKTAFDVWLKSFKQEMKEDKIK